MSEKQNLVTWSKKWRFKGGAHFTDVIFDLFAYVLGMKRRSTTYNKKVVYIDIIINDDDEDTVMFKISNNGSFNDIKHTLKINLNTRIARWDVIKHKDETFTTREYFKIIKNLCRGLRCIKLVVKDMENVNLFNIKKYTVPYSALQLCLTSQLPYLKLGFNPKVYNYSYKRQLGTFYDTRQISGDVLETFKISPGQYTLKHLLQICLKNYVQEDTKINPKINPKIKPKIKRWLTTQLRSLDIPQVYVLQLKHNSSTSTSGTSTSSISKFNKHTDIDIGSAISSLPSSSRRDVNREILYEYKKARRRMDPLLNPWLNPKIPKYKKEHVLTTVEGLVSLRRIEIPGILDGDKIKKIVLCGDVHTDKEIVTGGQFVLDWLVNTLIKRQDKCIDLFIENDSKHVSGTIDAYDGIGPLFGAVRAYLPIINKFKNLRVHDVDIRIYNKEHPNPVISTITDMFDRVEACTFVTGFSIEDGYKVMIQLLFALFFHIEFKVDINALFSWSEFSDRVIEKFKEYDGLISGGLITMFKNVINDIFSHNDKIVAKIEKQISNSYFNSKHNRNKFFGILFKTMYEVFQKEELYIDFMKTLFMPLMDVYCLARMFRTFNDDKRNFSGVCSEEVEICVVYVGDAHARVYTTFIRKYFKDSKLLVSENDEKILDLDKPIDLTN